MKGEKVMKKIHLLVFLFLIGLALAPQVKADMMVIDIDPPDSDTNPQWVTPSNPATEEVWVEGLLGVGIDITYLGKDEDNIWNDGVWNEGDPSSDWTIAVLKYGVGKPSISNPDHWAIRDDGDHIVDFGDIAGLPPLDSLSHVTYFGSSAHAPEPATMLLFGTGLAGLGVFRRKLKKA